MTASHPYQDTTTWVLTEFGSGEKQSRTIKLPNKCVTVGRSNEADICIALSSISKLHAKLWSEGNRLHVQDLGSTNGTHCNGVRVQQASLVAGDLLQFSNAVFKVGNREESFGDGTMEEGLIPWAKTLLTFEKLISERAVVPYFQPIITMDRMSTPGHEVLARSNLAELRNPAAMFEVAERLGQEATLSEMMRDEAARILTAEDQTDMQVFVNTHPIEFGTTRLIESLSQLSLTYPRIRFTVEIHEGAVTRIDQMLQFRDEIVKLGMQLSYDDFGAGQGRLLELIEVPPNVLKFDMQLIRGIDSASRNRQDLLSSLVRIAKDSGSVTLAEGVETESEHETCVQLGFELGQGFLYGRPSPIAPVDHTSKVQLCS